MRFVRKLLGAALLGAGVLYVRGRRKAVAMARAAEASLDESATRVASEVDRVPDEADRVPNEADLIEVVAQA